MPTISRGALKAARASAAHALLFSFTVLLLLKLNHVFSCSWWLVFAPVWLFHVFTARTRFSIPAPSYQDGRHWIPFHSFVAIPLLVAFELLLCVYLESSNAGAVELKMALLPVLLLKIIILIDSIRMCVLPPKIVGQELTPQLYGGWDGDVIHQRDVNVFTATAMLTLSLITLLLFQAMTDYSYRDVLMDGFSFYIAGESVAYTLNLFDYRGGCKLETVGETNKLPSMNAYHNSTSGLVVQVEDRDLFTVCMGSLVMIALISVFQILLFMYLQGVLSGSRVIQLVFVFSPLLLLQGAGVIFSILRLVERSDFLEFMRRGTRILGWWSIDKESIEDEAQQIHDCKSNTFCGNPPEVVKKMPKSDLVEEVWALQLAISEQLKIADSSFRDYQQLYNEKFMCKVCFEKNRDVVLLPCKHLILCRSCGQMSNKCPLCRVAIRSQIWIKK